MSKISVGVRGEEAVHGRTYSENTGGQERVLRGEMAHVLGTQMLFTDIQEERTKQYNSAVKNREERQCWR